MSCTFLSGMIRFWTLVGKLYLIFIWDDNQPLNLNLKWLTKTLFKSINTFTLPGGTLLLHFLLISYKLYVQSWNLSEPDFEAGSFSANLKMVDKRLPSDFSNILFAPTLYGIIYTTRLYHT